MILETENLILRPFKITDANDLYEYSKDARVKDLAGWNPHRSVEYSKNVIKEILAVEGTFAIVLKSNLKVIGQIGLNIGAISTLEIRDNEAELFFWVDFPYWKDGYAIEACKAMLNYGFNDLGLHGIWCMYNEDNKDSFYVQNECGFRYHHTMKNRIWIETGEMKTVYVTYLLKDSYNP